MPRVEIGVLIAELTPLSYPQKVTEGGETMFI